MKLSKISKWITTNLWLVLFITIFVLGLVFIVWMGTSEVESVVTPEPPIEPVLIEKIVPLEDLDISDSPSESPNVELVEEEEQVIAHENPNELCPTLLIKRGNKLMLFNKNMPELPGENPIFFNHLDEYIEYVKTQRKLYNQSCPILFLQEEVNTQGENVYRVRNTVGTTKNIDPLLLGSLDDYFKNKTNILPKFTPPEGPKAFNNPPPNQSIHMGNTGVDVNFQHPPLTPYKDANRSNQPFNQGYYGFDPTNQYVGKYTVLDQIHNSTKTQNNDGLSDNPMDTNWGGAVFTQEQVESGKYQDNQVQPPTNTSVLTLGEYPKAIEDNDIPTQEESE